MQIHNAIYIDLIMPVHNLIEYGNNNSKTSGSLWQYYRDEPVLTPSGAIASFHTADNNIPCLNLSKKNHLSQVIMVQKMLKCCCH